MGRRSRRRGREREDRSSSVEHQGEIKHKAKPAQGRPPPPWGTVPLTEIAVLVALVLGIVGFVVWGRSGQLIVAVAAVLGSLAGLELVLREHLAGYRSHTTLLSALVAMAVFIALALLFPGGDNLLSTLRLVGAAVVFSAAFLALRLIFRSRSGGVGFR